MAKAQNAEVVVAKTDGNNLALHYEFRRLRDRQGLSRRLHRTKWRKIQIASGT